MYVTTAADLPINWHTPSLALLHPTAVPKTLLLYPLDLARVQITTHRRSGAHDLPTLQLKQARPCSLALVAVLKTLLFYPLDLARVRIAADTSRHGHPRVYPNVRTCLSKTWRQEGVRGLYRGLLLSLVGTVPYLSLSFTAYDWLKVCEG